MNDFIELKDKKTTVVIEKGELISFKVDNTEYIHQKGTKGWRRSDIEMFPVIGPTIENNYKITTKKGVAIQDQHGLLRELTYTLVKNTTKEAEYIKEYQRNTLTANSRFPKKSPEAFLSWPYNFSFIKHFSLKDNILTITFILTSEEKMPFMLGYHPAFSLSNTGKESVITNSKKTTLKEIQKAGANAFPFLNSTHIILENFGKKNIEITTTGFNNFMLWSEIDTMLCIEPISQYTSFTDQKFSEKNMRLSQGENIFSTAIKIL